MRPFTLADIMLSAADFQRLHELKAPGKVTVHRLRDKPSHQVRLQQAKQEFMGPPTPAGLNFRRRKKYFTEEEKTAASRERAKRWAAANTEKLKAYYTANKAKLNAASVARRAAKKGSTHVPRVKATAEELKLRAKLRRAKWAAANPEKVKASRKKVAAAYYQRRKAALNQRRTERRRAAASLKPRRVKTSLKERKVREAFRKQQWYKNNPEKVKASREKSRLAKLQAALARSSMANS